MSFLDEFFHTKREESVVLIDIGTHSVAGAYARVGSSERPSIIYAERLPVKVQKSEPREQAMIRVLKLLGDDLMHDGAPLLVRAVGNGEVERVIVSIDAPWQKALVRSEQFEQRMPFLFTRDMVAEALERSRAVPSGYVLADERIVNATLNGYETRDPYGKRVHRASVTALASFIDESVLENIRTVLQSLYQTRAITYIGSSSLRYQAIKAVFPHEREELILDIAETFTSIALVHNGSLAEISEVSSQATHHAQWLKDVTAGFATLAEHSPLPRTIFLLARDPDAPFVKNSLEKAHFGTLWLSDNPPKIIPVLPSHTSILFQQAMMTPPDAHLLLMALYAHVRSENQSGQVF